ncbi:hypothetical protein Tco_0233502 [Tanacetum coccineum]
MPLSRNRSNIGKSSIIRVLVKLADLVLSKMERGYYVDALHPRSSKLSIHSSPENHTESVRENLARNGDSEKSLKILKQRSVLFHDFSLLALEGEASYQNRTKPPWYVEEWGAGACKVELDKSGIDSLGLVKLSLD